MEEGGKAFVEYGCVLVEREEEEEGEGRMRAAGRGRKCGGVGSIVVFVMAGSWQQGATGE